MPRKRREPEYAIEKTKRPKRRVKGRDVPEPATKEPEVLENKPLARRVRKVVDAFTEIENLARNQADAIKKLKEKYAPMVAEQEEAIRAQQPYIEEELAIPADEAANALYRIDQYTIQVIQLLQEKMKVIRTPSDAQKLELVLDRLEKNHSRTYNEIIKFIESVAVPTTEELPGAREMAVMPTLEKHKVGWSNRVGDALFPHEEIDLTPIQKDILISLSGAELGYQDEWGDWFIDEESYEKQVVEQLVSLGLVEETKDARNRFLDITSLGREVLNRNMKVGGLGEWVGKGWDWVQEQVSNFTSAVGDFLNNIWPLEKDLQEAIVELEEIGSPTLASKVSIKAYYYQDWKFIVWQGYEGDWYWSVEDAPYHLDGKSVDKKEAIRDAKNAIDKRFSGFGRVER